MSVRNAILGLLAQQPRHGYELRAAFEAMVGGDAIWDVKPAQIYTTLARLQEALERGDSIRTTPLTATFGFEAFREKWGEQAIPLFALDPKGTVRVFSTQNIPQPEAGWTLISLMPTVANNKRSSAADGNGQPATS